MTALVARDGSPLMRGNGSGCYRSSCPERSPRRTRREGRPPRRPRPQCAAASGLVEMEASGLTVTMPRKVMELLVHSTTAVWIFRLELGGPLCQLGVVAVAAVASFASSGFSISPRLVWEQSLKERQCRRFDQRFSFHRMIAIASLALTKNRRKRTQFSPGPAAAVFELSIVPSCSRRR